MKLDLNRDINAYKFNQGPIFCFRAFDVFDTYICHP